MIRRSPALGEADSNGGRVVRSVQTMPLFHCPKHTGHIVVKYVHGVSRVHFDHNRRPRARVVQGGRVDEHRVPGAVVQPHAVCFPAQNEAEADFFARPFDTIHGGGFLDQTEGQTVPVR